MTSLRENGLLLERIQVWPPHMPVICLQLRSYRTDYRG
jgi:hypothetical protein